MQISSSRGYPAHSKESEPSVEELDLLFSKWHILPT